MKARSLPGFLVAAWAAALPIAMTDAVAADKGPALRCKISTPARVAKGAPVMLTFELANRGKAAMNVLNWNTPLEGFFGSYLAVTGPQGEVEYNGPMVKRGGFPRREEYVTIKPGAKVTRQVNLLKVYALPPGKYEVAFSGKLIDATTEKIPRALLDSTPLDVECAPVSFEVTGR